MTVTTKEEFNAIMEFLEWKDKFLARKDLAWIGSEYFDAAIEEAMKLDCPATADQLIRYRDHYYPKEEDK
jgi:hypothetical protein